MELQVAHQLGVVGKVMGPKLDPKITSQLKTLKVIPTVAMSDAQNFIVLVGRMPLPKTGVFHQQCSQDFQTKVLQGVCVDLVPCCGQDRFKVKNRNTPYQKHVNITLFCLYLKKGFATFVYKGIYTK